MLWKRHAGLKQKLLINTYYFTEQVDFIYFFKINSGLKGIAIATQLKFKEIHNLNIYAAFNEGMALLVVISQLLEYSAF